jgi:hypothetical protein
MNTKVCLVLVFFISVLFAQRALSADYKVIYSAQTDSSPSSLKGYVIKNNNLYVCLSEEDKEKRTENRVFEKTVVYKVVNLQLQPSSDLTVNEAEEYIGRNKNSVINGLWWERFEPMEEPGEPKGRRLKINKDKYAEFGSSADCTITVVDGTKRALMKEYFFNPRTTVYAYIENGRLYFGGFSEKHKKNGIFAYNISGGGVKEITSSYFNPREIPKDGNLWPDFIKYENPVRIPQTPYLLFCINKRINKGVYEQYRGLKWNSLEHYDIKNYFETAVIEVPEWK